MKRRGFCIKVIYGTRIGISRKSRMKDDAKGTNHLYPVSLVYDIPNNLA
jgi:hypothetical protein